MFYGAIEAGGTKFRCLITKDNKEIASSRFPTTNPIETMDKVISFFEQYNLAALGVACFGPINLDETSKDYGMILNTPKISWQNFNIYYYLKEKLNTEVYINTDVGFAGLGEYYNSKINNLLYITVGTGIGCAFIKNGKIFSGITHSEMGHVIVNRHNDDNFESTCPFHQSCLEGLASGLSLSKRYNLSFEEMGKLDKIWDIEGYYLAQAIYNYILIFSPEKIIIGGGVSSQEKLIANIYKHLCKLNNNYFNYPYLTNSLITTPTLGDDSSLFGAITYVKEKSKCMRK